MNQNNMMNLHSAISCNFKANFVKYIFGLGSCLADPGVARGCSTNTVVIN